MLIMEIGSLFLPEAVTETNASGVTVKWSESARIAFWGLAAYFIIAGAISYWFRVRLVGVLLIVLGLFNGVMNITLTYPARIEVGDDQVEIRDRPTYFKHPLVLRYTDIEWAEPIMEGNDQRYAFGLPDGDIVELPGNPLIETAWPIILARVEAASLSPQETRVTPPR